MKNAEFTQFNRVKTEILEKREEYIKSLQMLLQSSQANSSYVISWIEEKMQLLEDKAAKTGQVYDKNVYEGFKREVT